MLPTISDEERSACGVSGLPDTPNLTTKELQEKVARAFAEQIYIKKSSKENFVAILMSENCWLDWSLFQCFYVEQRKNKIFISNSLSGEAYDYCIRKFLRNR